MKRKTLLAVVSASLVAVACLSSAVSYADRLSDAKNQAADLANQAQETQKKINSLKQQENALQAQLRELESQISDLQKSIVSTQADIIRRNDEIAKLKQQIAETQQQIDEQYQVLQQRVRVMYEDGSASYLDVLFSATSFSDLLDRLQLLSIIAQQDQNVLNDIRATKQSLDTKNAALNQQLQQLQSMYQQLLAQKNQQESMQQKEQGILAQVHSERLSQEAQLSSENAALQNLRDLIAQLEAQEGGYSGPSEGWTWPVPGHTYISSGYGWRTWSDGSREFHNGIDIPAPLGTPIVAATGGKVLYAGPASGFGDWIVIESAGGLLEIYGHMYAWEIKVSPGQIVHTGQVIAGVGSNGFSTGPHLHFTIAKGFDASGFPISVDPTAYVGK